MATTEIDSLYSQLGALKEENKQLRDAQYDLSKEAEGNEALYWSICGAYENASNMKRKYLDAIVKILGVVGQVPSRGGGSSCDTSQTTSLEREIRGICKKALGIV